MITNSGKSFRRRGLYVSGPVFNTTPNALLREAKVILRQVRPRPGVVYFSKLIRSVAATPAVDKLPVALKFTPRESFRFAGSVVKTIPYHLNFDPRNKKLLPIRFTPRQEFKRRGKTFFAVRKLQENAYTACTFAGHFITNGWNSPQDQVDAGYPIYIQPTDPAGYYEEIIDYGTLLTNNIVTVLYNENVIEPGITVTVYLSTSTDGVSYSSYVAGTSLFVASLRYLKFKLDFTSSDDHAVTEISNINIRLDVKREVDSGTVDVLASDTAGTVVTFNKTFKDIDSITLTPLSTTMRIAIYDFVDIPNPTDFKILLFDSGGTRVDGTVSWKARGIV